MTILVTGGLGYIGSHTVTEVINSDHNVVILDNLRNSNREVHQALEDLCGTSIPFYQADILDEQALDTIFTENDIQGIIHFAALKSVPESLAKPVSYFENNIKGVIHLMRAVERYNIPYFVFSSSCTVYGEPDQVPVTETTPTTRSITPYGNSKLISEMMLDEFTRPQFKNHKSV
jgi:UDP-glucose 4-epimerase